MKDGDFLKYGLTGPPENGTPFNEWQAQVNLIMLRKISDIEENCPMCLGRWKAAKAMLAVCVSLTVIATAIAAILGLRG